MHVPSGKTEKQKSEPDELDAGQLQGELPRAAACDWPKLSPPAGVPWP